MQSIYWHTEIPPCGLQPSSASQVINAAVGRCALLYWTATRGHRISYKKTAISSRYCIIQASQEMLPYNLKYLQRDRPTPSPTIGGPEVMKI